MTRWEKLTLNQIGMMIEHLDDKVKSMAESICGINDKLQQFDIKFDKFENRMDRLEIRMFGLENRFISLENKMENGFDGITNILSDIRKEIKSINIRLDDHETKLVALPRK